ncbi:MAG: hypothetical protein PHG00_09435 [Methylococcales bacterium]|nr:hypothetical protein [Methylococcales bacterium]
MTKESYYCHQCSGSGEGMSDGSTCRLCKGLGELSDQEEQGDIAQAWAERNAEIEQYGY